MLQRASRRISAERKERMLRQPSYPKASPRNVSEASQTTDAPQRAVPKVVARNLLEELSPLVIPLNIQSQGTIDIWTAFSSERIDDAPPQVPPKSPRTESRASPRSKKLPHSASSSTSTTYSVASPCSTSSPIGSQLYTAQYSSNSSISLLQTPSAEKSTASTIPPVQASRVESPSSHQKKGYPLPVRSTSTKGPPPAVRAQLWHQKGISEVPLIDRGRPTKKGDPSLIRSLSKPLLRSPPFSEGHIDIPRGFKATEAPRKVPDAESRYLKKQADEQVEEFKVLPIKQVSKLTKVSTSPRDLDALSANGHRSCGFSMNVTKYFRTHTLAFVKAGEACTPE